MTMPFGEKAAVIGGRKATQQITVLTGAAPAASPSPGGDYLTRLLADALYAPVNHSHPWSAITATPTTLAGYGIVDAQPASAELTAIAGLSSPGYVKRTGPGAYSVVASIPQADVAGLTTALAGKEPTITTLPASRGGTGLSSFAVGDLLYANTTTTLARLADVATGNVLRSGGVGVAPAWGKVALGDMATLPANTFIGNSTGSSATPLALTVAQMQTALGVSGGPFLPLAAGAANPLTGVLYASQGVRGGNYLLMRDLVGYPNTGAIYGTDVTPSGTNYVLALASDGSSVYFNATTTAALDINGVDMVTATASGVTLTGTTTLSALGAGFVRSSSAGVLSSSALVAGDLPGTISSDTTGSAAKWTTARTLTIGATGKAVDGSANVSWSLAEIGAAPAFTSSSAGQVWATPAASSGVPGLRLLVASDIPALNYAPPHSLGSSVVLRSNGSGGFAASQITDAGSESITLANNTIFNALAGGQINLIFRNTAAYWTSFYSSATEAGFRDYNDAGSANSYPIYWTRGSAGILRFARTVNVVGSIQVGGTEIVSSSRAATFPSLTIGSLSGMLKASSGVVSAATSGTDYASPHSLAVNIVLKSNGTGGFWSTTATDDGTTFATTGRLGWGGGTLRDYTSDALYTALYGSSVATPGAGNYSIWIKKDGARTWLNGSTDVGLAVANANILQATAGTLNMGSGVVLQHNGTTILNSSRALLNLADVSISKAASDTIGVGSFVQLADAASGQTKGWALQLGASNTLDAWNYASGAWTKRASISSTGIPTFSGLAASTLRMATVDASGTLGATTWAYDGPWLPKAGGTLSGSLGLSGSSTLAVQALVGLSTRVATINSSGQLGVTSYDANGPWLPQAGGAVTGLIQADGGIRLPHLRVTGNTTLSGPGIVSVNATCTVTLPTPSVSNLGWIIWINSTGAYTVTINAVSGSIIGFTPGISNVGRQMFQVVMTGASTYAWQCN